MSFHLKTLPKNIETRCVLPSPKGSWPYVHICNLPAVGVLMEQDFAFVEDEFGVKLGKHLIPSVCQGHADQISSMIDPV